MMVLENKKTSQCRNIWIRSKNDEEDSNTSPNSRIFSFSYPKHSQPARSIAVPHHHHLPGLAAVDQVGSIVQTCSKLSNNFATKKKKTYFSNKSKIT